MNDPAALPSAAELASWLAQSHDLLAVSDEHGRIAWANAAFELATGLGIDADLLSLTPVDWHAGAPRRAFEAALRGAPLDAADLPLRTRGGETLWVRPRIARVVDRWLWTWQDTTRERELAERAQHQEELLEMAQEFGRLGVWEREIPSGRGRWDRHVFGFWGLQAEAGTPPYADAAAHIHPDDQTPHYLESTRRAGRYSQRYRVIQPDGSVRWIHSQWEVKNGPDGQPARTIGIMVDDTQVYELARSRDETAAQLKLAVDLGRIVVWRHDTRTQRIHYNDHGFAVLGIPYRPEGLTVAEHRVFVHPDDQPTVEASIARSLVSDTPVDAECRFRRADGAWRHVLVRRVVERDSAGEPLAFVGVALDITDQIDHSRRADTLAQRIEAAAEAARVGIWTVTLGTNETQWNAQMYRLFGIEGEPMPPTRSAWLSTFVHPDDRARVASRMYEYVHGSQHGALEIEFRHVTRSGAVRWMVIRANRDLSATSSVRVFGIAMDVTERHEVLAQAHAASERAALIARHAGIGTWESSATDRASVWDEQMFRLRGLPIDSKVPDREQRLASVHPDDRHVVIDADPSLVDAGQATSYEFRVRLPDGSYRWMASRSAALRDETGAVVRRVGVNWDVTEAKNAEQAKQQALLAERESRAKSQFLSRMSHELRTPLNAVLGFTQLLQAEAQQSGAASQAGKLNLIHAAGEHLMALIDDALDLSALDTGALKLQLRAVPLAGAVAQAAALVETSAREHGVTLHVERVDGIAQADPTRLQQVLLNLLTNAIKYNRRGGDVWIDAAPHGDRLRVSVRDTGQGIRAEQLAHVFEPFNRLGLETEAIRGSGLGLAIVKALVERMQGQVNVMSRVGVGSLFEVTLPAAPALAAAADAAAPLDARGVAPNATRGRTGQLLYIEDNSVNVLLVEELVKTVAGLRIASEATGTAGVARARALRPDVILIDLQLPDIDGFEVLRRLREHDETRNTPCIALSANALPEDIARGIAAGFDDYWTKPIKFKPFVAALERLFPIASAGA